MQYRTGSITKTLTAVRVLRLAAKGGFLDDPVSGNLPADLSYRQPILARAT